MRSSTALSLSLFLALLGATLTGCYGTEVPPQQPTKNPLDDAPPPAPTVDASKIEDKPGERKAPFDKEQVDRVLMRASRTAGECAKIHTEGPFGDISVKLTLASVGKITAVEQPSEFGGTPIGKCIEKAFIAEIIPNWDGADEHTEVKVSLKKPEAPEAPKDEKAKPKKLASAWCFLGEASRCAHEALHSLYDLVERLGGEAREQRQRERLTAGPLGVAERREARRVLVRRQRVQRARVVNGGADALRLQVRGERVAQRAANDHLLAGVAWVNARGERAERVADAGEAPGVAADERASLSDIVVEVLKLDRQHGGLERVEPAVATSLTGHASASLALAAVLAERAKPGRERRVICRDGAPIAQAAQRLGREEAKAAERAHGACLDAVT